MKLLFLLMLIGSCVSSSPRSSTRISRVNGREYNPASPHCRDNDGTIYRIGQKFVRRRDGWVCNCTLKYFRTVLTCAFPTHDTFGAELRHNSNAFQSHCVYNGRRYSLNSVWRIIINGNRVECTCNATAHLKCHTMTSSQPVNALRTAQRQQTGFKGQATYKCQHGIFRNTENFAIKDPGDFYAMCTCETSYSAKCRVLTKSGTDCNLPFIHNGRYYRTCASLGPSRPLHCSTTSPFDRSIPVFSECIRRLEDVTRYYGYIFTYGGNSNGARCHFPFRFRGVSYNSCVTIGRRRNWCATTFDYDADERYGYCKGAVTSSLNIPLGIPCKYDTSSGRAPSRITWYKLTDSGREKIYTFDVATRTGRTAPAAREYVGRLSMTNARVLLVDGGTPLDVRTFQCDVSHANDRTTDLVSSPTNLRYIYSPTYNKFQMIWESPTEEHDAIKLEYNEEGATIINLIRMIRGRNYYVTYRLRPGVTYQARVYAIYGTTDSEPCVMTFTIPLRYSSETRPSSGVSEDFPSADQLLARPQVRGNDILLNWYPTPFMDVDVTGWLISYQGIDISESDNITLSSSSSSHILKLLHPRQRYSVALYALIGRNRIEVATTDVFTEHELVPLPLSPRIDQSLPTAVTLSWSNYQATDDVTSYDVSYRESDRPASSWILLTIPSSSNPRATLTNLSPSTSYDVRITPITDGLRGIPVVTTVNTPEGEPVAIAQPQNLRLTNVTRWSFLATWNAPNDVTSSARYRVLYRLYSPEGNNHAVERLTSSRNFMVAGLEGGREYLFQVFSILNEEESEPASETITTRNEVCFVENRWREADEKFYKLNVQGGYMQNCTCARKKHRRGGRWWCKPIVCFSNDGVRYTLNDTWVQLDEREEKYESCVCTISSKPLCNDQEKVSELQEQNITVSGRAVLRCPHDMSQSDRPTIRWSKVTSSGNQPVYTYSGSLREGYTEVESEEMSERLSMTNEEELVIDPVRDSDSGTYECTIQHLASIMRITHQILLNVIPDDSTAKNPHAIPTASQAVETPDVIIVTSSIAPDYDVTGHMIEHTDVNNEYYKESVNVTSISANTDDFNSRSIQTNAPFLDQIWNEPDLTPTGPILQYTTSSTVTFSTPSVPPRSPFNLRFNSIGRTSVTVAWNAPYYKLPLVHYRVEYVAQDTNQTRVQVTTQQRYYHVTELEPGRTYQFFIYATRSNVDSQPVVGSTTTTSIGDIPVKATSRFRSYFIGDNAKLTCVYDTKIPGKPVVRWYKLSNDGSSTKISTFEDGILESSTVGDYAGRIHSDDVRQLVITNLRSSDDSIYRCDVTYPTGGGSGVTRVTIVGPPNPVVFTSPLTSESEREHTISWKIVSTPRIDLFYLNIRRRGSSRRTYTKFRLPDNARSFIFRNLRPGQVYEGNLNAINVFGNSPTTDFNFTTASLRLEPPSSLSITNLMPTQLTVHVIGSTNGVLYYRIRYAPLDDVEGVMEQVIEGTNSRDPLTLTKLIGDTTYVLHVTSVGANRESLSLRATVETPPTPLPPSPTLIKMEELTSHNATLSIIGPTEGVERYELIIQSSARDGITLRNFTTGIKQNLSVSLEPNTKYTVMVASVNEYGRSETLQSIFKTPQEITPPSAPTTFVAIRPRAHSVAIAWNGSIENVLYHVIEYFAEENQSPRILNTTLPEQSYVITDLIPDTRYQITIKAVGVKGHSPSLIDHFVTKPAAPQLSNLTVKELFPDKVIFDIVSLNGFADYYVIKYYALEKPDEEVQFNSNGSEITLNNLDSETAYRISVTAVKGDESSEIIVKDVITNQEETVELSIAPSNLQTTNIEEDQVTLAWDEPEDVRSVVRYFVEFQQNFREDLPVTRKHVPVLTPYVTLSSLEPGTEYLVRVYSVGRRGETSQDASMIFTTLTQQEQTPSNMDVPLRSGKITAPRGVLVSRREATEAELHWYQAENPDEIDGYLIEYKPKFSLHGKPQVMRLLWDESSAVLSNLLPGTEYEVKLYTVVRGRQSEPSLATFMTKLNPPTNLQATPEHGRVVVTWTNPESPHVATRFAHRMGDDRWHVRYLLSSVTTRVIKIPHDDSRDIEISVSIAGGNTESLPATITVQGGRIQPFADISVAISMEEVDDRRAIVVFDDAIVAINEGWTLMLEGDDEIVGNLINLSESTNEYLLENLNPSTHYVITILDENRIEIGFYEFITKAARPENFHISNVTSTIATLTWQGGSDDVASYVASYRLVGTSESSQYSVNQVDDPSITFQNLSPSGLYEAKVISVHRNAITGQEEESAPALIRFTASPAHDITIPVMSETRPPPISNVRFSQVTETSFHATWDDLRDREVVTYRAELISSENSLVFNSTLSDAHLSFYDLNPNTEYLLTVFAVRSSVESLPTTQHVYTIVSQPLMMSFDHVHATSFDVTWQPRAVVNPLLAGYVINAKQVGSNEASMIRNVPSNVTRAMFVQLHPGTTYDVIVRPVVTNTEVEIITSRVSTTIPQPFNIRTREITETTMIVEWTQPHNDIMEYRVEYQGIHSATLSNKKITERTETMLDNLLPDTQYVISIYSLLNKKRSKPVQLVEGTRPVVPTPHNIEIFEGDSSISLRWIHDEIHSHFILVTTASGEMVFENEFENEDRIDVNNLHPSTNYVVYVYAVNRESEVRSLPATFSLKTKPRQPATLYVRSQGPTSILVTWPQVEGSDVTGYRLTYHRRGGKIIERFVTESTVKLDGLKPSSVYGNFTIQTVADDQLSEPYVYPRVVETYVLPAPRDLVVQPEPDVGPKAYVITWHPIRGYDGTYDVRYYIDQATQVKSVTTLPGVASYRFSHLLSGMTYTFEVFPTQSPTSESTTSIMYTTNVPAPIALSLSDVTERTALLKVVGTDDEAVTSYQITYHKSSLSSPNTHPRRHLQHSGSIVLSGLEAGTEYQVDVVAKVGINASPIKRILFTTREQQTTVAVSTTQQPQLSRIISHELTNGDYRVTWQPFHDSDAVQYYKVISSIKSDGEPSQLVIPSHLTEAYLSKLLPGEVYDVTVVVVLRNKQMRDIGYATIETSQSTEQDRSTTIQWEHSNRNFSKIRITAIPQGNPQATNVVWELLSNATSAKLTGLLPGTTYFILVEGYFRRRYVTILEISKRTAIAPPTNLRTTKTHTRSITIEWEPPNAPNVMYIGYSLTYLLNGEGNEMTYIPPPPAEAQRTTLRNLEPGKRYVIRLYARSRGSDSYPAELWTETSVPTPHRLQTNLVSPNLIGISWQKPLDSLTHYTLRVVGPYDRVIINDQRLDADETTFSIQDLQPDTRYHIYLTSWMRDLHSSPAYRTSLTPAKITSVTTKRGRKTEDGYILTWKGRSRSVEGWKVVVEPLDGSNGFERYVDRFTKRYKLQDLNPEVEYLAKIYPYSGNLYGTPAIAIIPASQISNAPTRWRMQVSQTGPESITLVWNSPFHNAQVSEYQLAYKLARENDVRYRLVVPPPQSRDLTYTIQDLQPAQIYSIKMTASNAGSERRRTTAQIVINATTLLPPPSEVHMERLSNGTTLFSWHSPNLPISKYVLKYKIHNALVEHNFTIAELPGDVSSYLLTSSQPSQTYEIELYASNGQFKSNALIFRIDMPDNQAEECKDPDTRKTYQVGEHWISEVEGLLMNCTCHGPDNFDCDTGDWCFVDETIYNPDDTWTREYDNNKAEVCICNGRDGYRCYTRSCDDNGRWYDDDMVWTSTIDGSTCTCTCPSENIAPCITACSEPTNNLTVEDV